MENSVCNHKQKHEIREEIGYFQKKYLKYKKKMRFGLILPCESILCETVKCIDKTSAFYNIY